MLAWSGPDPLPLPGLASSGGGVQRKGGCSVGDDSLSVYRSTIRPISSGWFKSCTRLINPPSLSLITSCQSFPPGLLSDFPIGFFIHLFSSPSLSFSAFCDIKCTHVSPFPFCVLFFFSFNVFFLTYLFSRLFFLLPHLPFSVHLLLSLWHAL